jgi:YebC/PmpR family DNA-binding regulatory protein
MAGHSKWKQIKRAKAVTDSKRAAVFTKLGREISMAAKAGGGDPDGNARLRLAILKAKEGNMPSDIINRAIDKAVNGSDNANLDEIVYEGYGPGGTAVMVEAVTDNRNRTASEIRNAFGKGGGNLAELGSVAWVFTTRGVISMNLTPKLDAEELTLTAIDAGAEDVEVDEDSISIYTKPDELDLVRRSLEDNGIALDSVDLERVPNNTVALEHKEALQTLRLLERLEDLDDVQKVYSNADFPDDALEEFNS